PDDRHRQHLGGQTEGSGDRRQHLGERVHRAGAPEGPDRRQDGDQERNDPHRDVEALFRALDEGLVDLDAPDPAVERDADQQHDQDPARRDLDEGLHFQTRSSTLAETIATVSAQIVAPRQGRMIPAGSLECAEARSAITVVGTSCNDAVLMARNNTCALVAVPGVGFSLSSSSIALIPNGVAALPRPSMLAAMLSSIAEMGGWPSGTPGKSGRKIGRTARASLSTSPAFSAIFKSPSQSAMTPIRPMASVTPCAAPSNAPWPTAFTSPLTAPAMAAATNSSTKTMFTVSLRSPWTRNVAPAAHPGSGSCPHIQDRRARNASFTVLTQGDTRVTRAASMLRSFCFAAALCVTTATALAQTAPAPRKKRPPQNPSASETKAPSTSAKTGEQGTAAAPETAATAPATAPAPAAGPGVEVTKPALPAFDSEEFRRQAMEE